MFNNLRPWQVFVVAAAGWLNRQQQQVIDYLQEEHRVLREQLGTKRRRFTDDQRRRLAAKAKLLGRRALSVTAVNHLGQRRYGRKRINGTLSGRDPAVLPACN